MRSPTPHKQIHRYQVRLENGNGCVFAPLDDDRCIRARSGNNSGNNDAVDDDSFERLFRNLGIASELRPNRGRRGMLHDWAQKTEVDR